VFSPNGAAFNPSPGGSTPWNFIEMTGERAEGATHGVQDPAAAGFVPVCSRVTGMHLHDSQGTQGTRATQEGSARILPAVLGICRITTSAEKFLQKANQENEARFSYCLLSFLVVAFHNCPPYRLG